MMAAQQGATTIENAKFGKRSSSSTAAAAGASFGSVAAPFVVLLS